MTSATISAFWGASKAVELSKSAVLILEHPRYLQVPSRENIGTMLLPRPGIGGSGAMMLASADRHGEPRTFKALSAPSRDGQDLGRSLDRRGTWPRRLRHVASGGSCRRPSWCHFLALDLTNHEQ